MAKRVRKSRKQSTPAVTTVPPVEEQKVTVPTATEQPKLPLKSATATGAAFHVLAGRPAKPAVIEVFGKTGYSLSWVARAMRLNITPEELCQSFKTDPASVKTQWDALAAKK